jgi:hypothetical protein
MKLSFISALALAMAGSATASPNFLRSSNKDVANIQEGKPTSGEVGIQIHGVEEDTLNEECQNIITDAFAAAFEQVYGEKGLTGTIKPDSEQVFKERSPDTFMKASSDLSGFWSLRYFYWYGVYWVSLAKYRIGLTQHNSDRNSQNTLSPQSQH